MGDTPERRPSQPGPEGQPHKPSFSLGEFAAREEARAAQLRPPSGIQTFIQREFIQRVRGVVKQLVSLLGRTDS